MLEWYWFLPIVGFLIIRFIYMEGNPDFWKLTRKYPDAAQFFFESRPDEWLLRYSDEDDKLFGMPDKSNWDGPYKFKMSDPSAPIAKLYANKAKIQQSQKDFATFLKNHHHKR